MVELSHGVIRRVGGLEDLFRHETDEQVVIRRVGGLEDLFRHETDEQVVIRRVGGLEDPPRRLSAPGHVIRRVGGLEEKFRCPHGERNQALMLCSLDCDLSGAHSDRKAKADGRFIITSWWCLHKCRWLPEHRDEIRFVAKMSDCRNQKTPPSGMNRKVEFFGDSTYEIPWNSNLGKTHFAVCTTCFGATLMLHVEIPN